MSEVLMAEIVDVTTGESYIRPLTTDELAYLEANIAEDFARQAEQDAKAAARVSALAKLKELGLSQEEIEAL
jgi:hypothetical protein